MSPAAPHAGCENGAGSWDDPAGGPPGTRPTSRMRCPGVSIKMRKAGEKREEGKGLKRDASPKPTESC